MSQTEDSADNDDENPEEAGLEDKRGPHLWLNWRASSGGQPARSESHGNSALVHPIWEERTLYSDGGFTGELECGPYAVLLTMARAGDGRIGVALPQLVLRHRDHLLEAPFIAGDLELDVSGWTGGDIGDQMSALLALALNRRIRSGGVTRQGFHPGDPLGRPYEIDHAAPALGAPRGRPMLPTIAKAIELGEAAPLLDIYARLGSRDAAALTRAAGQYADALWLADTDPRLAWIKLVGALETTANRADFRAAADDAVALLKRHRARLHGELKKQAPDAIEVVAKNLAGTFKAEAKFVAFTLSHRPEPPPERPDAPGCVNFNDLGPVLSDIYALRSRDLHDGIPFPPPLCEPPLPAYQPYERFPGLGLQGYGGTWTAKDLPMYFHTFAYIVHGALINWWQGLEKKPSSAGINT